MNQIIKPASVDFNALIKNSATLTLNGQSKMIETLTKEFTEEESKWYIANLYIYMNYHPTNDYPINLDTLVNLVGFANKENAKRTLKNNFTEGEDYKILLIPKDEQQKNTNEVLIPKDENLNTNEVLVPKDENLNTKNLGGRPKEKVMMNIDTFKNMCMLVKTEKSKEIRKYYVKLENIYNKIIKEEIENKDKLLENQQQLLEKKDIQNIKEKEEILISSYHKKSIVYFIKISSTIYKFGLTNNIKKRMNEHRRLMKQDIVLIFCIESKNNLELENNLKCHLRDNNIVKRVTMQINNNEYTELIQISDNYDIGNLTNFLINSNNTIGENIEIKQEILSSEKTIIELENTNIQLQLTLNEQKTKLLYINELESQLTNANNRIKELIIELEKIKPLEVIHQTENLYPIELYSKFVDDYCEIGNNFKCSGKELILNFKDSLQNTIYQAQINSMYDINKFTNTTCNFLPSFKREFFNYFETLLNNKASAIKFRNKETLKSNTLRGFVGIRIKAIDEKLYDESIYIEFFNKTFVKDSYEYKIKTITIEEQFIMHLANNNIKQLFRYKTPEFSKFKKELNNNISNYFNIKEQRIQFTDAKSPRPGFHCLKLIKN